MADESVCACQELHNVSSCSKARIESLVSAALDRAGEGEKPRAVDVVAEQRLLLLRQQLLRIPACVLLGFEGDVKSCRAAQRDVLRGQDLYGLLLGIHSFQIREKIF